MQKALFPDEELKTFISVKGYIVLALGFKPIPMEIYSTLRKYFWQKLDMYRLFAQSSEGLQITINSTTVDSKEYEKKSSTSDRAKPTSLLWQNQEEKRKSQESGRLFVSKAAVKRVELQKEQFSVIAKHIHKGGKEDLLKGIAAATSPSTQQRSTSQWDGSFNNEDIITLTKLARDKKESQFMRQ